jgi:crotonobetainyl-CoA:carnitine CoA-transferase CaiB-like acyl-CoA transferase
MTEPTGPLRGFRILDLTTVLFGPFGTQTLGDWGAEIIKVESLTGDTWRTSGRFRNRGMSGQFMAANRNKRSIALDRKHSDGKTVLRVVRVAGLDDLAVRRHHRDAEECGRNGSQIRDVVCVLAVSH